MISMMFNKHINNLKEKDVFDNYFLQHGFSVQAIISDLCQILRNDKTHMHTQHSLFSQLHT